MIADAHFSTPRIDRKAILDYVDQLRKKGMEGRREVAICAGIHILAVQRDPGSTQAAYSSVPLLESLIRYYVALVLELPLDSSAFHSVSDEDIETWWDRGRFRRPSGSDPLNMVHMAVLAAIQSVNRGHALFTQKSELDSLVSTQGNIREPLGHFLLNPTRKDVDIIIKEARKLFQKFCIHSRIGLSLDQIEMMIRAPDSFLRYS